MSQNNSLFGYNESHALLSMGIVVLLFVLPVFYNIGPSSFSTCVGTKSVISEENATLKTENTNSQISDSTLKAEKKNSQISIPVTEVKKDIPKVETESQLVKSAVVTYKGNELEKASQTAPIPKAATNINKKIYFAFNSFELPENAKKSLLSLITYLKENKSSKLSLKGFHDNVGIEYEAYNKQIALKRAKEVSNFAIAEGIESSRIILEKPESSLGTGANWEARRVEASILSE